MKTPKDNGKESQYSFDEVNAIVDRYRNDVIGHAIFKEILEDTLNFLMTSPGKRVVLIYGPTGCGKTKLGEILVNRITNTIAASTEHDPGRIIAAMSRVPSSHSSTYDWNDVYIHALQALNEPLIDFKTNVRETRRDAEGKVVLERTSKNILRRTLIKCLENRKLRMYFWDEGHHFAKFANAKLLLQQMENIKYILDESKTSFVLAGIYDILELKDLSGQLGRRAIKKHFCRYNLENESDKVNFNLYLFTLQSKLPLPQKPNFVDDATFFYERCLGCAGILKDLLSDSLVTALMNGMTTLTKDVIEENVDWPTLAKIKEEIEEGEALVSVLAQEEAKQKVQFFLGTSSPSEENKSSVQVGSLKKQNNSQGKRVGERKPHRDPIGE
ncbi:MAG: ATP-binding protein [Roseiflexaceae bacterium]